MPLRLALTGIAAAAALVGLLGCGGGAGRPVTSTGPIVLTVSSAPPVVQVPARRLIVPNRSIAGIRLGESRRRVEKAFGRGKVLRGWASYFGGRLLVDYVDKTVPSTRVQAIRTSWAGYRTRSGVRVGSTRQDVRRALHAGCGGPNEACDLGTPGSTGTMFWMRRGKVAWIMVWFVS